MNPLIADEPNPNLKSEPTPGPYYYKPVEKGSPHEEAGTYLYKVCLFSAVCLLFDYIIY